MSSNSNNHVASKLLEEYPCSDLYLAAFLMARGLRLARSTKDGQRVTWTFQNAEKAEDLKSDYLNNGAVNVGDYRSALHNLKSTVFGR